MSKKNNSLEVEPKPEIEIQVEETKIKVPEIESPKVILSKYKITHNGVHFRDKINSGIKPMKIDDIVEVDDSKGVPTYLINKAVKVS